MVGDWFGLAVLAALVLAVLGGRPPGPTLVLA